MVLNALLVCICNPVAIRVLVNFLLLISVYLYEMKNRILHIVTFLLLAIFLIGTVGVPVSKHICFISGHADVAFFADEDFKGCCADDGCKAPVEESEDAGCCDDQNDFLKLDIVQKYEEQVALFTAIPAVFTLTYTTCPEEEPITEAYTKHAYNLPPPSTGKDILLSAQVFRL